MSTPFNVESFAKLHQAHIDSLLAVANTAFAGVERLAALNLNTSRSLLEDSAASTRALLGVRNLEDFVTLQGTLTQPALDKALAWSRDAREIGSATHDALTEVIESRYAEASQSLDAALDTLVKNAPAGTDAAVGASVTAFKAALAAATQAYDSLNQATRQAARQDGTGTPAAAKRRKN